MGCCVSSDALGDIANKTHLAASAGDEKDAISIKRQKSPDIENETASFIDTLAKSISDNPMSFPEHINSGNLYNLGVSIGQSADSDEAQKLVDLIKSKLENQFESKYVMLNSAYIYLFIQRDIIPIQQGRVQTIL